MTSDEDGTEIGISDGMDCAGLNGLLRGTRFGKNYSSLNELAEDEESVDGCSESDDKQIKVLSGSTFKISTGTI